MKNLHLTKMKILLNGKMDRESTKRHPLIKIRIVRLNLVDRIKEDVLYMY